MLFLTLSIFLVFLAVTTWIGDSTDCGCCGGSGCDCCSETTEELTPDFILSGTFGDNECSDCAQFDGAILQQDLQFDPCSWINLGNIQLDCASFDVLLDIDLVDDECILELRIQTNNITPVEATIYRKTFTPGSSCNAVHTLDFVSTTGTKCDWPAQVQLTPSP